MNKLIVLLLSFGALIILGMVVTPVSMAMERYVITNLGQFAAISIVCIICFTRVRFYGAVSAVGRVFLSLAIGMFCWGLGALTWFVYNVVYMIEVPYPSIADPMFLAFIPFTAYGLLVFDRSVKPSWTRKDWGILSVCILAVFSIIFVLFIQGRLAEDVPPLEMLLNIAYPFGDVILMALGIFSLFDLRGSMQKGFIAIAIGIIILTIADLLLVWTIATNMYYIGSIGDILYVLSFCIIGVGVGILPVSIKPTSARRA